MISTPTRLAALLSLALPLASATFSFNTSFTYPNSSEPYIDFTIPGNAGISDACSTAYAKPVPCDEWLIKGLDQSGDGPSEDEKFEKSTLDALCTTQCLDGLLEWQDAIRADCTKADIDAAGKDGSAGSVVLTSVSQPDMPIVEMLYWPTCLKDLNNGTFCYLEDDINNDSEWASPNATDNTPDIISAFCGSSCMTQISVLTWDIIGKVYGDDEINIGDATKLCPKLDTSKFPFLSSNTSSSSSSNSGNSTTTGVSGSNSTSSNGTIVEHDNAAGALKAGSLMWGLGSTVVAIVVGFGML